MFLIAEFESIIEWLWKIASAKWLWKNGVRNMVLGYICCDDTLAVGGGSGGCFKTKRYIVFCFYFG